MTTFIKAKDFTPHHTRRRGGNIVENSITFKFNITNNMYKKDTYLLLINIPTDIGEHLDITNGDALIVNHSLKNKFLLLVRKATKEEIIMNDIYIYNKNKRYDKTPDKGCGQLRFRWQIPNLQPHLRKKQLANFILEDGAVLIDLLKTDKTYKEWKETTQEPIY